MTSSLHPFLVIDRCDVPAFMALADWLHSHEEDIAHEINDFGELKEVFKAVWKKGASMKTLHNSDISGARENVKDIQMVGNGDMFQLLCKASSKEEGWMKSTKACEISGVGCIVQVTTQQGDNVAEAVCFVPGVKVVDDINNNCRILESFPYDPTKPPRRQP